MGFFDKKQTPIAASTAPLHPPTAAVDATAPIRQFTPPTAGAGLNVDGILGTRMAGARYPYLPPDMQLTLRIDRTEVTLRTASFIAEFTVIDGDEPGKKYTWVQPMAKNPEVAWAAVKRFVASAVGCSNEEEFAALGRDRLKALLNAVGEPNRVVNDEFGPNPLKDQIVRCQTQATTTKEGRPFTRVNFSVCQ